MLATLLVFLLPFQALADTSAIRFQDGIIAEAGGMHNIHVTYDSLINGELSIHYGDCDATSVRECHHTLGSTQVGSPSKRSEKHPTRFVWLPPSDVASGGCLHAVSSGKFLGSSSPITIIPKKSKRWLAVRILHTSVEIRLTFTGCRNHGCGRTLV